MKVDLSYTELIVIVDALCHKRQDNEQLVRPEELNALENKLIAVMNGYYNEERECKSS